LQPTIANCDEAEEKAIDAFSEIDMDASVYESLPFHFKLKVEFQKGAETKNNTRQLAGAFGLLERKKEELGIQFYSVSLMNLEQIFIDLSRKQLEADETLNSEGLTLD